MTRKFALGVAAIAAVSVNAQIVKPLGELTDSIDEVVVTSTSAIKRVKEQQIGVEKINVAELAKVPALFGEHDIMRSVQLLPGIKSEGDGSSGYQVRGGTAAQNLILLDGASIYNSGHLMGIFSAFNDEALTNASLYKGQIPAMFGGATSSVFDIGTRNGNMQKWHYSAGIGLLSAKASVEGPVAKDRLSLLLCARRSYLDMFLKASDKYKDNVLNFYDINTRLNFKASEHDYLSLSLYNSRDNMGMSDLVDMHWGNTAVTGKWNHMASDKVSFSTSLLYSNFGNDVSVDISNQSYALNGFIRLATFKENMLITPNSKHTINIGVQSAWQQVKSGDWTFNHLRQVEKRKAWNNDVWVDEDWKVTDKLQLSAGLRLDLYSCLGDSTKTYANLEPRFSAKYSAGEHSSIKLGFSRTTQAIHAIRNGSTSLPFDRYTVSTSVIKPEQANQISLGFMQATNNEAYDFSIEGYYKKVNNIYDYVDGKSFTSDIEIANIILGGKGRAYGIELCLRKNIGKFTGWASYTLSWSENKISGINNDNWYTANNDRRHDVNIVGMYHLNRNWDFSATFTYQTGQAMSAPSAKYIIDGNTYYYYAERNGYHAPAYHRLDLSATNTKKFKTWERQWSFGIYNVYNHYNPYMITFEDDDAKPSGTKCTQVSLFGLLPFVSFNIKY